MIVGSCVSPHSIKEQTVTEAVVAKVQQICAAYLEPDKLLTMAYKAVEDAKAADSTEAEIQSLQSKIASATANLDNPYDNAMAENFFSILKTECIYRHKPKTYKEANDLIDRYIQFYNHERIQNKTGVAPLTLRHSA